MREATYLKILPSCVTPLILGQYKIMNPDIGHVYILSNPALAGLVKIGHTKKADVNIRAVELSSSTSIPLPFVVEDSWLVENPMQWELRIHARLAFCRIAKEREFFRIELPQAQAHINNLIYGTDNPLDAAICGMKDLFKLYSKYPSSFKKPNEQALKIEEILKGIDPT